MATQNQYVPEVVTLDQGLNFVTPKVSTPPGSLSSCYNFEIIDKLGYARVRGNEYFDGRTSPSLALEGCYTATLSSSTPTINTLVRPGDSMKSLYNDSIFGVVTSSRDLHGVDIVNFVVVNTTAFLPVFQNRLFSSFIDVRTGTSWAIVNIQECSLPNGKLSYSDKRDFLQSQYNLLVSSGQGYDISKIGTTAVDHGQITIPDPNYNQPIGLHLFRDNLYAVQDLNSLSFTAGAKEIFPGDTLVDAHAITAVVYDYQIRGGSWGGGDAQGTLLLSKQLTNGDSVSITRPTGTVTSAFIVQNTSLSGQPRTWQAGLWKSGDAVQTSTAITPNYGWQQIDLGYKFAFKQNGTETVDGGPLLIGRDTQPTQSTIANLSGVLSPTQIGWTPVLATPLAALNDSHYLQSDTMTSTGTFQQQTSLTRLTGFDFSSLPADAVILGFTVSVDGFCQDNNTSPIFQVALGNNGVSFPGSNHKNTTAITSTNPAATNNFVLGSATDTWGVVGGLTRAMLTDPNFEVLVTGQRPRTTAAHDTYVALDRVQITVTYQATITQWFFYNSTDGDVTANITNYWLTGGAFKSTSPVVVPSAVGTFQVINVAPFGSGNRRTIKAGDQIRTTSGGGGSLLGFVDSNMVYAGLPSQDLLNTNGSQYEFITANFYGNKDWDAIYGVSGAGMAFVYDTYYLRYIYTGVTPSVDKPRHVAFFNFHLCLGYDSGLLNVSSSALPENFDALDGASSWNFGSRITGLLEHTGTTLAVYCDKLIGALNGTGVDNFSRSLLSPNEGAIEYTVVNMGKPVYCSYKGITTFDQTAAYGNFLGSRLSANITPWLLPRLTSSSTAFINESSKQDHHGGVNGVIRAFPKQGSNQYCVAFKDGYILTMTFMGAEQTPAFTLQQPRTKYTAQGLALTTTPLVIGAVSAGVDSFGRDRTHVSCFNPAIPGDTDLAWVWELDKGWGWGGEFGIYADLTTNANFYGTPFDIDVLRKIRVHGQSRGFATLFVNVAKDYELNPVFSYVPDDVGMFQPIDLPQDGLNISSNFQLPGDYLPVTNIANIEERGRSFSIKFANNLTSAPSDAPFEPPFIVQALQIQHDANKGDV